MDADETTGAVVAFGPGRVNLIGEHTDYNGGLSLPFAIAEGVTVTASRRDDGEIRADAADLSEQDRFAAADPQSADGWRAFVRGVVAELAADGLDLAGGADLRIEGTVAQGSGLSSSAALEVALVLALTALHGTADPDRMALARLCSRVENDWVGAHTGLLDQMASLLGRAGQALRIDFATLDVTPVVCDLGDWSLVTVDSRDPHTHAGSGYNERRSECDEAARRLGVEHLAHADPGALDGLPEVLARRTRHVLGECDRVDGAVAALGDGDLRALGALLDASHASLRDLYDASTDAVERTVDGLKDAGAVGARMVGGGFGGHVLGLLPPGVAPPPGATVVTPSDGGRMR